MFYVILTISYLRAQTTETSSLPTDSSRPLFKQIEIFSILTVWLYISTVSTFLNIRASWAKSLRGQLKQWIVFFARSNWLLKLGISSSGYLRHYYLIKYVYFVKCYFNRFASVSDPEKKATNTAQWKKKKHVKRDFKYHVTLLRQWCHKTRFPSGGRVANLNLRNFHHRNVT